MGREEKRPLPVAVCTRCGALAYDAAFINRQCGNRLNGKRCRGCYGSALRPDDWETCSHCGGTGDPGARDREIGENRCMPCRGSGWIFVRKGV